MDAFGPKLSDAQVIVLADARIEAERPQGTAALTVSGTGDSLTAAPTWATATILTADATALAGDCAIDVAGCPDGTSRWLRLTPASTKTVTISATGGTVKKLGGLDTNPFAGDGSTVTVVSIARIGTVYDVTITAEAAFA
jgi:hypothetical protein